MGKQHPNQQSVESILKKPFKVNPSRPLELSSSAPLEPQGSGLQVLGEGQSGEAVSCSSSRAGAREGFGSIICHLQAYKHEHSHTTHMLSHTPLITSGEGADKVVVLEQRRAKNTVKSKTYIRFLLRCFLHSKPPPPPQFFVA